MVLTIILLSRNEVAAAEEHAIKFVALAPGRIREPTICWAASGHRRASWTPRRRNSRRPFNSIPVIEGRSANT